MSTMLWIDLALYVSPTHPGGLDWPRLQKRVRKEAQVHKLDAQEQRLLRKFSEAVGYWALIKEDMLADYLPPATVQSLVDLAPSTVGDPVHHAAIHIAQYLNEAKATMTCTDVADDLRFHVKVDGIREHTLRPWLEWIQNPVRAIECEHCGAAFHPARSDARFCGVACRTAAKRERKETTA